MDSVLRKHFSGDMDLQNRGYFFKKVFVFGFRPQKGVWGMNAGGNFFGFWRGGQEEKIPEKIKQNL